MKRPKSHIIDSIGEQQLRGVFEPQGWAVNKITEYDYGIDFDIQIFIEGQATGDWFKVQLKSSETTDYSTTGEFVSQQLGIDHAIHYAEQLQEPILIIHADVKEKRTFWYSPQLDKTLSAALAKPSRPQAITVRIPSKNELPRTLPEMLLALERVQVLRGALTVKDSPVGLFAETIRKHGNQAELVRSFKEKIDAFILYKAHDLFRSGEFEAARSELETILVSKESSVESKFSAIIEEERITWVEASRKGVSQSELPKIHLQTSVKLQKLTRKGPPALKFYALIAKKAAELEVLTFRNFGLYLNLQNQLQVGSPVLATALYVERLSSARQIAKKYAQCIRLAQYATRSRHAWALPSALLRIVEAIPCFTIRLGHERKAADVRAYLNSALQLCRLAAEIAAEVHDDQSLTKAVSTAMLLYPSIPVDALKFAEETITKIKDPEEHNTADLLLRRALARFRGEKQEGDIDTTDEQIYENMAAALGINMGDPNDPIAKLVRLGIYDLNPGRVLTGCEHSFVSLSGPITIFAGFLAHQLHLPTMASKIIHCDLHNYAVRGRTLDSAYSLFKERHCDKCPDRCPRPDSWQWSEKWQDEENRKHVEFMMRFRAGTRKAP